MNVSRVCWYITWSDSSSMGAGVKVGLGAGTDGNSMLIGDGEEGIDEGGEETGEEGVDED